MYLESVSIYHAHTNPHEAQDVTFPLFNSDVVKFLKKAEEVVKDVLGEKTDSRSYAAKPQKVTKIGKIQFGNTYSGVFWNSPSVVYSAPAPRSRTRTEREEQEKKDNTLARVISGIVGFVVIGFAAYKVPQWWNNGTYAKEESKEVTQFITASVPHYSVNSKHPHIAKIWDIAVKEREINDYVRSNANKKIALATSAVAGAAFLILGALTAPEWMALGATVLVLTGIASIAMWSFENSDRLFYKKAKEIDADLEYLRKNQSGQFTEAYIQNLLYIQQPVQPVPGSYNMGFQQAPAPQLQLEPIYPASIPSAPPKEVF